MEKMTGLRFRILLRRHRAQSDKARKAIRNGVNKQHVIHLTINGIAAGLRNSG